MADDPYRDDREAALQRAAELEQEVERLRQQLEAAAAATERRALDETETEELKVLRVANASLRRENAALLDQLAKPTGTPTILRITVTPAFAALATFVVVALLIVLLTQK